MRGCQEFRPLLFRVAEGEAEPDEALQVARHLPACTTCRIVLAREMRLARVLDAIDDSIPVEPTFLDEVMRSLPEGSPPARPTLRQAARKGIKLTGLAGLLLASAAGTARLAQLASTSELRAPLPRLHPGDLEGVLQSAAGAARLACAVLDEVNAGFVPGLPSFHFGPAIGLAAMLPGALAIAALSSLVAVIARRDPRA